MKVWIRCMLSTCYIAVISDVSHITLVSHNCLYESPSGKHSRWIPTMVTVPSNKNQAELLLLLTIIGLISEQGQFPELGGAGVGCKVCSIWLFPSVSPAVLLPPKIERRAPGSLLLSFFLEITVYLLDHPASNEGCRCDFWSHFWGFSRRVAGRVLVPTVLHSQEKEWKTHIVNLICIEIVMHLDFCL